MDDSFDERSETDISDCSEDISEGEEGDFLFILVLRHLGYFLNRVPTALHRSGTGVPIF